MPLSTIVNKNLQYSQENGWKYQFWLKSEDRLVYALHSGPLKGRVCYQRCFVQEVRPDEIFQISWVEETDTVISIIVDLPQKVMTSFMAFSNGHWSQPGQALGNKRDKEDLERWRELAKIKAGLPGERHAVPKQTTIDTISDGPGDLEDIDDDSPLL